MATLKNPVPKGAETRTNAQGQVEYKTQGGNWRNTVTGSLVAKTGTGAGTGATGPVGGLLSPNVPTPSAPGNLGSNAAANVDYQQKINEYNANINANLNRFDQQGTYGGTQWTQDPATGKWTQSTGMNQQEQGVYNAQKTGQTQAGQAAVGVGQQLGQYASNPYDINQAGGAMPNQGDILKERQGVQDTLMNTFESRNAPIFAQQQKDLQQQLADQGVPPDSEQYKRRMASLGQQQTDARQQAMSSATSQGLGEFNALNTQGLANRQQGVSEYTTQYNAPMATFGSLQQLGGTANVPTAATPATIDVGQNNVGSVGTSFNNATQSGKNASTAAGATIGAANIAANASTNNAELTAASNASNNQTVPQYTNSNPSTGSQIIGNAANGLATGIGGSLLKSNTQQVNPFGTGQTKGLFGKLY